MHAGPEIYGRLYEDEGDGYGDARTTVLVGGVVGQRLRIERRASGDLPFGRKTDTLRIYGLPEVGAVTSKVVEQRFADGVLEVKLRSDWRELEVEL